MAAPPTSGPEVGADVAEEAAVDDLELAAAGPDGAAAVVLGLVLGVAVDEGQVLHGQARVVLVVTHGRGPALIGVARVHVQDAGGAAAAEGDQAAAVDDDVGPGVVEDLGRAVEGDGHRVGPTREGDDAAGGDRGDERVAGAAGRGAVANHGAWAGAVGGGGLGWDGATPGRVTRRRAAARVGDGRVSATATITAAAATTAVIAATRRAHQGQTGHQRAHRRHCEPPPAVYRATPGRKNAPPHPR